MRARTIVFMRVVPACEFNMADVYARNMNRYEYSMCSLSHWHLGTF